MVYLASSLHPLCTLFLFSYSLEIVEKNQRKKAHFLCMRDGWRYCLLLIPVTTPHQKKTEVYNSARSSLPANPPPPLFPKKI